ncbi:putative vacuolar protein sorting-associated protein 13E [Bienertia sinuspersici]
MPEPPLTASRTIVALADIEGAQICLRELTITHHMASWESIQEILFKHYSRQFVHELYKVLDLLVFRKYLSHHAFCVTFY